MLCPCCGYEMRLGARACRCGARIVGELALEPIAKVQRLGPATLALSLFVAVALAAAVWTLWAATAGLLVILSARRAVLLARRDREGYGGLGVATAVLVAASIGGATLAGYAIGRIPLALQKRQLAQEAATTSAFYELANALADYKAKNGYYPRNDETLKRFLGRSLPRDYWDQTISYEGRSDVAEANLGNRRGRIPRVGSLQFDSFELKSLGPDGIAGSSDDIVMRDGVFYTSPEVIEKPLVR